MEMRKHCWPILCLIILFSSLTAHLCHGGDTISANQSLSADETIISSGRQHFELGFFKPGSDSKYYIGIWYKIFGSQEVVWVAKRESPLTDIGNAELTILDGNLVLLDNSKTTIWSTNISSSASNSVSAVLQDDGNLILTEGLDSTPPLWQSFDYPTHRLLPGGKLGYNRRTKQKQVLISWKNLEDPSPGLFSLELDPDKKKFGLWWNRSELYWTSGPWNGHIFSMVPEMRSNNIFNFSYNDDANQSYFTYSLYNTSILSSLIMGVLGQINQITWLHSDLEWNLFWSVPRQYCDVYRFCGAFATCQNSMPLCNCLDGFQHRSERDWNQRDFSGGCVRKTRLQCQGNDTNGAKDKFRQYTQMTLPEHSETVNTGSASDCGSICLRDCSCSGYAFESNRCLIWNGELRNLVQLGGNESSGRTINIRLAASEFIGSKDSSNIKLKVIIAVAAAVASLLLACIFTCIYYRMRNIKQGNVEHPEYLIEEDNEEKRIDVPFFSFESILAATNNFSDECKLGRGGFGPVYKGEIGGKEIAVKRLSSESGQGVIEFKNEVELIARLQHRNLVRLLGYCIKGIEKILLYEYMPNKSLNTFIFDKKRCAQLDWERRFNIMLGIARGLLYLHHDSRLRIIHRDMKTSNILLDAEMNPRISDFGLARIVCGNNTEGINTNRVAGTYGYMSPEYASDGLFSTKSDVFSFGVVMLEIITGRRSSGFYHPNGSSNLLSHAWRLWNGGKTTELVHESLLPLEPNHESEVLKCIHISLLCVQEHPGDRPSMPNVVNMLSSENTALPRTNKPAFVGPRSMPSTSSYASSATSHSNNGLTVTTFEGR